MTLALLLTAVTGAWAQTETLLTTITATGDKQASYSTANVATVSFSTTAQGQLSYLANWGWWGYGWSATVTAAEGYTITKCIFYDDANRTATDSEAPFVVETTEDDKTPRINETPIDGGYQWSKGIMKIEVYGYETPAEPDVVVTTNAASAQDLFTEASFNMPAFDATVNYELVRDMQDETKPVAFSGLPSSGNIVVKKGDDGKYQPAEALTIQLIDPLAAADAQNIIGADGITVKVLVGAENEQGAIDYDLVSPITRDAFLADMTPGYYRITAEPTDKNSPYDGTVYSSEFTVVEQYDLTVKPANDFSKGKIESVTVGTETVTPDATTGEATKTGITPDTEVKLKAKRGYVIEKVEAKKKASAPSLNITSPVVGQVIGSDGKNYAYGSLPTGVTAVAKICYVSGSNGLALALTDEGTKDWSTAQTTCAAHTPAFTGGTWKLASQDEWDNMFTAAGSSSALSDGFSSVGGTNMLKDDYWSSTEDGSSSYARVYSFFGYWYNATKDSGYYVRACLAF